MIDSNKDYMTVDFSMANLRKVGLLGGTFDPPHVGHIWLGELFLKRLGLSKIMLMPTFAPPHKINPDMTSSENRVKMCELITEDQPNFAVSTIEIDRGEVSFTADTLAVLKASNPDEMIFLIVGADMFITLRSWKNFDLVLKNAVICTVPRDNISFHTLVKYGKNLEKAGCRVVILNVVENKVSSTEIRQLASCNENVERLVTNKVADYMLLNNLYNTAPASARLEDQLPYFVNIARGRLSEKRFYHSLKVAEKASELALRYGWDEKKAYLAGVLHDIHKETNLATQLQILEDFDIMIDNPSLFYNISDDALTGDNAEKYAFLHAFSGSVFVEKVLGVDDREIINAIKYHCTARAGMSLFEKIIYVADYVSDDRAYSDVSTVRALSMKSLDETISYCLSHTIRKRVDKQAIIHPYTFEAYNYFINEN